METFDTAGTRLLHPDIARVVVPRDEIARRIGELTAEITSCYRGQEVTFLAVLTGSLVFLADLIRRLPLRIRVEVVSASSYRGEAIEPEDLQLGIPPRSDLEGRNVLVVDDILDTGRTLEMILDRTRSCGPASLRTCVLLSKVRDESHRRITPDFCGFTVAPEFVVGYGLDYNDLYRDLPDICVLRGEVFSRTGTGGAGGETGGGRRG